MSNYQVEPADQPRALTKQAIKSQREKAVQGLSRRQLLRTSLGAAVGLWLLEVTRRHARLPVAEPRRRLRRPRPDRHVRGAQARERHPADRPGLPGLRRRGARVHHPDRCQPPGVHPGRGPDGRRHRDQRAAALPALPAPRLQAEPVPAQLLARVPVPRLALRPPRDQGRRRPVRAGARSMDRFAAIVDADGVLSLDTGPDHPRAAPDRAGPAGHHPADLAGRLHLSDPTPRLASADGGRRPSTRGA